MKIGICGQMCSGKTTIANYINNKFNHNIHITSFASKLKILATELFGMKQKDRKLLINLGQKMRDIDKNVWINYTINESKNYKNVIIDDVRYPNELYRLKDEGFLLIKLIISKELQLKRLKQTYPENWKSHYNHINDNTEKSDQLNNEHFNYVINVDQQNVLETIDIILKNENLLQQNIQHKTIIT